MKLDSVSFDYVFSLETVAHQNQPKNNLQTQVRQQKCKVITFRTADVADLFICFQVEQHYIKFSNG